jgi:hypothetical protein
MFKNWKTTLLGIVGAILNLAIPIIQTGDLSELTTQKFFISAFMLAIGVLSKDFNVTGGTVAQDKGTTTPVSK